MKRETFLESAREIPIIGEFDICVIGGSCTGLFAAVRAARLGASVALIESNGFFGGTATAGLVNIWHSIFDVSKKRQIIAGLTTEIVDRLAKRDGVIEKSPDENAQFVLNTEELKLELDHLVLEAKVKPFLHTHFVSPLIQDKDLVGVAIEDKAGRRAIRATYFIDATGDGDLVHRMGLVCTRHEHLQPPTTCAIMRGLHAEDPSGSHAPLYQTLSEGSGASSLPKGFIWCAEVPGSANEYLVAGTRVLDVDCSDPQQLTQAEIEGRRQVRQICDFLRGKLDKSIQNPLVSVASHIGIRETRRAECLHKLRESEVLGGATFDDAIANGSYRVDIHHPDKPGVTFRYLDGSEVYAEPGEPPRHDRWRKATKSNPTFYQIPYRSLVPQAAKNVLVAGRLLSADKGAYGACRVMVNCNQTGEAAGVACVLALEGARSVADVDTNKLREILRSGGSLIL